MIILNEKGIMALVESIEDPEINEVLKDIMPNVIPLVVEYSMEWFKGDEVKQVRTNRELIERFISYCHRRYRENLQKQGIHPKPDDDGLYAWDICLMVIEDWLILSHRCIRYKMETFGKEWDGDLGEEMKELHREARKMSEQNTEGILQVGGVKYVEIGAKGEDKKKDFLN